MRSRFFQFALVVAASLGLAGSIQAGEVKITMDDLVLSPGQGGTMNIYIEGDGAEALLNFFNYQVQVALVSGTGRFEIDSPTQADLDGLVANPNYVFSSIGAPYATVGETVVPNDTLTGGDSRGDFDNTTIPATHADRLLLARFSFSAGAGTLEPTAGSVFSVNLTPLSLSQGEQQPNNPTGYTFFYWNDPTTFDDTPNGFTSISGSITVTAVPEPATLLGACAGLSLMLIASLRRR